jgi:predicted  nucleic acid-binding Zn-ribbon protein
MVKHLHLLPSLAGLVTAVQFSESAREQSLEKTWGAELEPETKTTGRVNPIKRVINMLTDMKNQLEEEAAKEAEMYDKMVCWCETNEKEKTKAIADAEAKDKDLSAEIEARSARFGSVSTEIEAMKKQIAEDTAALKEALAIREKEAANFRGDEKDTVQAITNLKNAIGVLKKHQGASFVQLDAPVMASVRSVLRDVSFKYELMMAAHPSQHRSALLQTGEGVEKGLASLLGSSSDELPVEFAQRVLAQSATQASGPGFLQGPPGAGESRASASNGIYGILTQMLADMEKGLSQSQKDEIKAKEDHEALQDEKNKCIDEGKAKLDAMEAEDAGNAKALSDAKEDLELTRKQRSADVEFLRNLRVTCQNLDREWEQRSKTRSQEILAVSEALSIITEDDNRELMTKSVSFLQEAASSEMQLRRSKAASSLRKAAEFPDFDADDLLNAWDDRRGASLTGPRAQLSTLAVTVQLDGFGKVKEAMDKMVADLKKEQQEEVELKQFCEKEFNQNEKETYENNEQKEDLEEKMDELEALIKKLDEEISDAKTQIEETTVGVKKASQTREEQNTEYQATVSDQRATQTILTKALDKLKSFYKKAKGGAGFVQDQQKQTPPVQFGKQKSNAGASPVIGMIEQIVEDSKKTEADAISTEKEAQANYETFVKDSNNLIKELTDAITEKTDGIASSKTEAENAKSDHTATVEELELLAEHKAELHGQCDFTLSNFDIRQKARLQEIEAIGQAKAILSGMK